jgi:predicted kinase
MARLISLSGLPGVGKSTIARELAMRIRAIHLRVDSVEAALGRSVLRIHPAEDAGYRAIAAVAKDNLLLGMDVIADTVNAIAFTRDLWASVAAEAAAELVNIEIVCEDKDVHRARVEARTSDLEGPKAPTWENVLAREYEPWADDRFVLDTSRRSVVDCVDEIIEYLPPSAGGHAP